jgi:16S rRNA (adenine1518-N6/adenine1519-N6)-dimethyltransferase
VKRGTRRQDDGRSRARRSVEGNAARAGQPGRAARDRSATRGPHERGSEARVAERAARSESRRAGPPRPAPRKRFGQHFLERAWVEKLVRDVAATADDTLIEIGPGRGALTLALAASGARIRAIEIDRDLAADLTARVPQNVSVVGADFLTLSPLELMSPDERVRVVGNLPYNVSSPILFRLLALARETGRIVDATLMLQREVAIRVAAGPGSGDYGPLSILTAVHADVERRFELPPGAFRPPPKVHSTVVRLRFRPPTVDVGDYARFERLVRTIFQQRRKTLANALNAFLGAPTADLLSRAGIDGRRRPETLSLAELAHLNRV